MADRPPLFRPHQVLALRGGGTVHGGPYLKSPALKLHVGPDANKPDIRRGRGRDVGGQFGEHVVAFFARLVLLYENRRRDVQECDQPNHQRVPGRLSRHSEADGAANEKHIVSAGTQDAMPGEPEGGLIRFPSGLACRTAGNHALSTRYAEPGYGA